MTTIGLSTLAAIGLLLGQGTLLQLSVAITGEVAPKYGKAMRLAFVAGLLALIGTSAWTFTFGWLVGKTVTGLVSGAMLLGIATVVYRRSLNVSVVHAFLIAMIQAVLSTVASSVAFFLIGHL